MEARHIFGLPGMGGGFLGFSRNSSMRPSGPTSMMPNSLPCSMGTGMAATVQAAFLAMVEVQHLPHVHAVHVVRAEDEDVVRLLVGDDVEVLVDGVRAALVPVHAGAHLRGHRLHVVAQERRHPPRARQVVVERVALVLREHLHPVHAGVDEVRENEVDDAVPPAEGNGGLGALAGERLEPGACTTCQNHRQQLCHRRATLAARLGRQGRPAPLCTPFVECPTAPGSPWPMGNARLRQEFPAEGAERRGVGMLPRPALPTWRSPSEACYSYLSMASDETRVTKITTVKAPNAVNRDCCLVQIHGPELGKKYVLEDERVHHRPRREEQHRRRPGQRVPPPREDHHQSRPHVRGGLGLHQRHLPE